VTDHCTFWPDGIGRLDWSHCCAIHDLEYTKDILRSVADYNLFVCVTSSGAPAIATVMFVGVSLFGWLFIKKGLVKRNG
jgi:hypothetical protein